MAEGPAASVLSDERSPTARALRETRAHRAAQAAHGRRLDRAFRRARQQPHDVTLRVPVGRMCVVAGVSGSGKSTLVRHVFYPALRRALKLVAAEPGAHSLHQGDAQREARARGRSIAHRPHAALRAGDVPRRLGRSPQALRLAARGEGARLLGGALLLQHAGAGAAPRARGRGKSSPRCLSCPTSSRLAKRAAARASSRPRSRSATPACPSATCSTCPPQDAAQLFANHPKIARPLATLFDLGVGYVQIGQGSNTLSGGEAQRLKLAAELTAASPTSRRSTSSTSRRPVSTCPTSSAC